MQWFHQNHTAKSLLSKIIVSFQCLFAPHSCMSVRTPFLLIQPLPILHLFFCRAAFPCRSFLPCNLLSEWPRSIEEARFCLFSVVLRILGVLKCARRIHPIPLPTALRLTTPSPRSLLLLLLPRHCWRFRPPTPHFFFFFIIITFFIIIRKFIVIGARVAMPLPGVAGVKEKGGDVIA